MYNLRFVNVDPGAAIATPDGAGARATKSKFQPGVYELASAVEGVGVWEAARLTQPTVLSELLDAKADPNCCLGPQPWWVPDRGESVAQRIRGEFLLRKKGKNIFLTLNGNGIHTSPTGRIRGS